MRFRLDLTLRPAEGALLRVLGTAERRGYTPLAIEGQRSEDGSAWNLALEHAGAVVQAVGQRMDADLVDADDVAVVPEAQGHSATSTFRQS